MFCTNCGRQNEAAATFCDHCGLRLGDGCPTCGTENRPDARFCRSCGTALTGPDSAGARGGAPTALPAAPTTRPEAEQTSGSPAAERRLVTVLFADLVSFTTFAEGRDPESVRDLLSRYFEAARTVIERHGGRVEKFIGDAVMAAWGAPKANEDDAERAVRASLEVIDAVRDLEAGLEARVGVLTGQAAVTVGATDQGMVAGDLVNTASRLQSAASANTVLVGEATMQAASSAIVFEPAGEHLVKGREAPVAAWRALRVVSERGGRSRTEGLEPPFVGREIELRLLKDLIHAIGQERRPRLVSISGPAGIGKSRLAWEFEKYVDGLVEEIYWHRGRAPSYGEGVTFWALGEMVRKRAGLAEADDEATTRERIHATVLDFVPDPDDRAWIELALLTLLGLEPAPAGGREVLFAAWRTFFERIAASGTTVLLFEDIQWADSGQLDFIDHLLEWSKGVPLFVVTLARPDLLERRPGWGTGARSFTTIGLEPLTSEQMRILLLGLVPEMPAAAIDAVLSRADGIPLYAVETVRMLLADGRLTPGADGTLRPAGDLGSLTVPDSLRALVGSRLDTLEPSERSLLQDASVLGKTFSAESVAALSDADVTGLEPRLRSLVKREVLEISVDPRSPERGQYGFVQSVIREVAYETLSRRDRRARHLAAARHFEGLGDEELAGVLATHYLAALEASDPGAEADALRVQARRSLRGAADRAMDLGAYGQALTCLRQGLAITEAGPEQGDLLSRAAMVADIDGRYEEAEELGRRAIEAHRAAGEGVAVARASAELGTYLSDASDLAGAVELLEGALEALAADDGPDAIEVRADILARLARALMRLGRYVEAIERADEALAIAEPRRLTRIAAEAFINKGSAMGYSGRILEPRLLLEAAVELANESGDVTLELRARNNLGSVLELEDLDAAQRIAWEAYALATRLGIRQMAQWLAFGVTFSTISEGLDWDASLALLDAQIEGAASDADRLALLTARDWILAWRGADVSASVRERVEAVSASSDPEFRALGEQILPAVMLMHRGRDAEALEHLRRADAEALQWGAYVRAMLVLCSHRVGEVGVAASALRQVAATPFLGRFSDATVALAGAGLAALEGRHAEALAGFRRSVDDFTRAGSRLYAALAQLDALSLLPDEPGIAGWADEARQRFETVKSPPLLERLDAAVAARTSGSARDDAADVVAAHAATLVAGHATEG